MKNLGAISANLETSTRAREFISPWRAASHWRARWSEAKEIARGNRLCPTVKNILSGRPVHLGSRRKPPKNCCRGWHDDGQEMGRAVDLLSVLSRTSFLGSAEKLWQRSTECCRSMRRVPLSHPFGASDRCD